MTKTTTFVLTPNEVEQATIEFMKRLYPELGQQELILVFERDYCGKVSARTIITTNIKDTK
jgi:hypothetical protein